jgi:hypothetical protein
LNSEDTVVHQTILQANQLILNGQQKDGYDLISKLLLNADITFQIPSSGSMINIKKDNAALQNSMGGSSQFSQPMLSTQPDSKKVAMS